MDEAADDSGPELRLPGSVLFQMPWDTDVAVLVTDAEPEPPGPRIVFVNAALERRTGYTAAELVGSSPRTLLAPGDEPLSPSPVDLSSGFQGTLRCRHRDGTPYRVHCHILPLQVAAGTPARSLWLLSEARSQPQERASFPTGQDLFRSLFDGSREPLAIADGSRLLLANAAFATLFGYDEPTQMQGFGIESLIVPEQREAFQARRQWRGESQVEPFLYEVPALRADGAVLPVEVRESSFSYQGRSCQLLLLRDLRSQKEWETRLRVAHTLEATRLLAGRLAHDLNNLLTVMLGSAELLAGTAAPGELPHEALDEIRQAGERARGVTTELLVFSGHRLARLALVALDAEIRRMQERLRRELGSGAELIVQLPESVPLVLADPAHVEQACVHLIRNAREAMPAGGQCSLSLSHRPGDTAAGVSPEVCLQVADTGRGMDSAVLARAREPFYTTKPLGVAAGLGLSIVSGLLEQAAGRVEIASEPGRGTTVSLCFPVAAATGEAQPLPTAASAPNARILLIDDEEPVRRVVAGLLRRAGYTVREAGDEAEVLRLCEARESFDLLLSDVVMPGLGGPELARRLVARGCVSRVVFLSANPNLPMGGLAGLPLAAPLLLKPFTPEALLACLHQALSPSS